MAIPEWREDKEVRDDFPDPFDPVLMAA